jgi:hypothetical protein
MPQHRRKYVRLDSSKILHYFAVDPSLKEKLSEKKCTVAPATLSNIMNGRNILLDTGRKFAELIGAPNVLALMTADKLVEFGELSEPVAKETIVSEWTVECQITGTNTASNGLTYVVWKLKHVNEANRFARAKHYRLASVPTEGQNRMNHYLHRHADICNKLARQAPSNAHFPRHITSDGDPKGTAWWVIDEWIDGTTLSEPLKRKSLSKKRCQEPFWLHF